VSVSATEAAFEGFRVTRHHPRAILLWAAIWLLGLIAGMAFAIPMLAPWTTEITAAQGNPEAISAEAARAVEHASYAFIPVVLLIQGLLAPAVYRAVLRPSEKRFGFVRLGALEGRVFIVLLVTAALSVALNVGAEWLLAWAEQAGGLAARLGFWLVFSLFTIALSVRLSLIAPITFIRGRLSFAEGWRESGRRFWPLLGMTIIALTMAVIVILLLVMIGVPIFVLMNSGSLAAIGALLMTLLMPLGMALVSTILWAPLAAICRDLQLAD
jgi:hypothetical protein